jgi:hypothetical protein
MMCRAHLMSWKREVLTDRSEARRKSLLATRLAKAAHLASAPTGRLVAVLGAVVHACGRFDENVLYLSKLRDITLRRRITVQLVGNDFARHRV